MRPKRSFMLVAGTVVVAVGAAAVPALASGTSGGHPRPAAVISAATQSVIPVLPGSNNADSVTGPPEQFLNEDGYIFDCWNIDGGITYAANAPNLHIWNYPGGTPEWEINEGAWFDSIWDISDAGGPYQGPYHCVSYGTYDGSYWIFGYRNFGAPNSTVGFMGLQYLDRVGFTA